MRFGVGSMLLVFLVNGCVILVLSSALMRSRAGLRKLQAARTRETRETRHNVSVVPLGSGAVQAARKRVVSICACVSSRAGVIQENGRTVSYPRSVNRTTLQMLMVPSIEKTITPAERGEFHVRLYLGLSDDDEFWLQHVGELAVPAWLHVRSAAFNSTTKRIPFNPLMQMAFDEGADYLVRVNDDTQFITAGWLSLGVSTLEGHVVRNVGVVGPTTALDAHRPGFMTHDMVHKTHLFIFKTYYPEVFSSWWLDDWISFVYEPGILSTKLKLWQVNHPTRMHGRRYKVQWGEEAYLKAEIQTGKLRIRDWISSQLARAAKAPWG